MTEPKLTPWFPARTKPARPGVYMATVLVNPDDAYDTYRYWTGSHWCKPASTPREASAPSYQGNSIFKIQYWRGLARPARAAVAGEPKVDQVFAPRRLGGS